MISPLRGREYIASSLFDLQFIVMSQLYVIMSLK